MFTFTVYLIAALLIWKPSNMLGCFIANLYIICRYQFVGYGKHTTHGQVPLFLNKKGDLFWVSGWLVKRLFKRFYHAK